VEHPTPTTASADTALRRLTLIRGRHRWALEWRPGDEHRLLVRLKELSESPLAPLDLFDIALIRGQMWKQIAGAPAGPLKPGLLPAD
jgi:hypothetical protein